jgi:phospholipid/cholesterol/gamma-HCH transport system ATP-binding protein
VGEEVRVEELTKSFGRHLLWQDVTLTLPPGEISVLLGPPGAGKSTFLKSLVGLRKPEHGRVYVRGVDVVRCSRRRLREARKLFGVLFQGGGLFGSMSVYDNIAFPLREHTGKHEVEIRRIVAEKMELVGLRGAEGRLPAEISGAMRQRAGLARALVLDPEIVLLDEPAAGLDPDCAGHLHQLVADLNAQLGATFLIVTSDVGLARTLPDNLGLLLRRRLVSFGPREALLTSADVVVRQFLSGWRDGPLGLPADGARVPAGPAGPGADRSPEPGVAPARAGGFGVPAQLAPSRGVPLRQGSARRQARVARLLQALPATAQQQAVRQVLPGEQPPAAGCLPAGGSRQLAGRPAGPARGSGSAGPAATGPPDRDGGHLPAAGGALTAGAPTVGGLTVGALTAGALTAGGLTVGAPTCWRRP